ncbi:MAG: SOS response-associated peptidase [Salinivirgaceae bacterium]|nr:SOS response-associated peptidase [Salinivirgaceae bacterium]
MCYSIEQVKSKIEKMIVRGYLSHSDFNNMPNAWVLKGFMFPSVQVITNEKPLAAKELTWGLIPNWANSDNAFDIRKVTLNAKAETLLEKASFKKLVGKKHCLIPVSGFYEWRLFNKSKYPHYIFMKNNEPFMLAGLWDTWIEPKTLRAYNTFTILTCEANKLMKEIHNEKKRMPVIINPKDEEKWLNATDYQTINELCVPYDDSKMEAHTIDKTIIMDKYGYNVPDVNKKVIYPELSQKGLFD